MRSDERGSLDPLTPAAPAGAAQPAGSPPGSATPPSPAELDQLRAVSDAVIASMARVIEGKNDVIGTAVTVLLAEGHLLLEDVPGVGKTMLAKALARSIDSTVRRIQFTPDLLPGDITGVTVFNQETHDFEFRPGAVFANIVVGDEINRASPKTQSALLECMEESQVTADGTTYRLPRPFLVMATQNPIEMEGTYPLPEAQRDRFMARISMGYPAPAAELAMLERHAGHDLLAELTPCTDAATIAAAASLVRRVYASPALRQYIVDLVTATRTSPALRLGASPRAALHLLRAARAHAAMSGRNHVLPDDVRDIAEPVLAHRFLVAGDAVGYRDPAGILADLLAGLPVPGRSR